MQEGSLVGGDVIELSSRIVVGGLDRKFVEWSIDREIDGDLPEAVVGGSGIKQATGSIVWAEGPNLSGTAANPWNSAAGWLPEQGESCIIYVSDGVTEWPQFVGVIDENRGDVGGRPSSTIVDYIDYLNRPVSHSTVLRVHPPKTEGGDYLSVGMSAGYAVDRTMRACGFFATPAMEPGVVWSVPAQMSMWPEYGNVTAAGSYDGISANAENYRAPWGWAVANFNCTYTPQGTIAPTDPVQITALASPLHGGNFGISAMYGSQNVQLFISTSRTARARLNGTEICNLALGPAVAVTLQVKGGTWTLRTNTGATSTGSATIPAGSNLNQIIVTGDTNTVAAGMQISKPPVGSEFQAVNTAPASYFQDTLQFASWMDVLPSYVRRPGIDLLTEISKANLAAMWFNERGQFQFIGSDRLRGRTPVQEITTLDDIRSLSWSDARLGMRSRVRVKYQMPVINRSKYSNILLWQGSGETMESGQEKTLVAEAATEEHWAEIDHGAAGGGSLAAFNAGRATWVGGYVEASDGSWSSGSSVGTWDPIRAIDDRTRVFGVKVGSMPAGSTFVLGTPDDAANYFQRFRGFNLPVLRGRAKVVYTEAAVESSITGPSGFPQLEHDAGPWGARMEAENTLVQDRLADFIAEQVTVPAPTITGMEVGYDPRRQLGDVVTITSELMGISLKALIVGVQNTAGDTFKQSLKVRIISAFSPFTTYADFEAAHADTLTYEQWRLLFPDTATYSTFNSEPLRGASA
ncbi:hypothetical protein [Arthrobacter sp. 18067]|uniref:hypothetical protein n=1 Tax=Arthrobacter sp. 18067 TaxID=2681413 RepID=UPI00135C41D9|nr:hypothetical protein [Arthrobacter sp. 18067]